MGEAAARTATCATRFLTGDPSPATEEVGGAAITGLGNKNWNKAKVEVVF